MVANQGYFANVGETRRQGIEAGVSARTGSAGRRQPRVGAALHADRRHVRHAVHRPQRHPPRRRQRRHRRAGRRAHPVDTEAHRQAGDRLDVGLGVSAGVNVVANSSQYLRGDEANLLAPIPGYVVVNARVGYQIAAPVAVFVLVNNLFDARYSTFGVLGDATDVLGASYDSPRFLGPGAPRAAWLEVDLRY